MRKRITSLLLALALCLTLLPTAALAEGEHTNHPICGDVNCKDSSHALSRGERWGVLTR